jgi:hypothetical protein
MASTELRNDNEENLAKGKKRYENSKQNQHGMEKKCSEFNSDLPPKINYLHFFFVKKTSI